MGAEIPSNESLWAYLRTSNATSRTNMTEMNYRRPNRKRSTADMIEASIEKCTGGREGQ